MFSRIKTWFEQRTLLLQQRATIEALNASLAYMYNEYMMYRNETYALLSGIAMQNGETFVPLDVIESAAKSPLVLNVKNDDKGVTIQLVELPAGEEEVDEDAN